MVVTLLPATVFMTTEQERTGCPSTCTVHAPQSDIPQPNFVPVSPTTSRRTQRSGISGATSTVRGEPLRVKVMVAIFQCPAGSELVKETMGGGSWDVKTSAPAICAPSGPVASWSVCAAGKAFSPVSGLNLLRAERHGRPFVYRGVKMECAYRA